jgi:hypothetical protein
MIRELLVVIVGFSKWILKGGKTDLKEEIYGNETDQKNMRGINYFIGITIFFVLILLFIFFFV